jgi:hypothetical protein
MLLISNFGFPMSGTVLEDLHAADTIRVMFVNRFLVFMLEITACNSGECS